ncbi:MAG: gliding motility-associated C-terminal domain-containing protein [Candidatus Latescibacteria bacterium]|nr:gliding motility-associated C-terminal domain-containing protein [Candidatus Latescibacterota bacterium]
MIQSILLFFVILSCAQGVIGQTFTVNTKAKWEKWIVPKGIVKIENDGRIGLVAMRKNINASLDAPQFLWSSEEQQKKKFPGGVIAESNQAATANLIDGRRDTYWSPDPQDPLEKWKLTLNLGRVVAATRVRLVFGDTLGMKPFEQFAVYISEGANVFPGSDLSRYNLLGRTSLPNRLRIVEYPIVHEEARDTTSAGLPGGTSLNFSQVQYVQIIFTGKTSKAALAEIEVEALGDNIALGTFDRFGKMEAHVQEDLGPRIFDGNAGTNWIPPNVPDTEWNSGPVGGAARKPAGAWFEWDLGATFWVNEIVTFFGREGRFGTTVNAAKPDGYIIQTSDGSPRPGGEVEYPGGRFEYIPLVDVWNRDLPYRYQFSHAVDPPRRVRWIFWRHAHGTGIWGRGQVTFYEMQIYGEGFPAEASLTSSLTDDDLIKATQGKNITGVAWDAEVPSEAKLEILSRTGDTVEVKKQYFNKDGKEISARDYGRLPANLKGDTLVTVSPGLDWSDWSDVYTESGGIFLSPSPRQYAQFQIRLISGQRDVAPTFRSLSIRFTVPFVKEVKGILQPTEAKGVDQPTRYAYGIWPVVEAGNPGFNRILIKSVASLDTTGMVVEGKRGRVDPTSVSLGGDSLIIQFPQVIRDSVTVRFSARVIKNATVVEASVGNSTTPGVWQFVDPIRKGATIIFLPTLSETETLFGNLIIDPPVFTPNGDGVNDQAVVTFILLKVLERKEPRVAIYDLKGGLVKELVRSPGGGYSYLWDGRRESKEFVPPGMYICRISIDAQAGKTVENRTVGVIY